MLLLAAPLVLKVDAFLVATLIGAERTGNVVKFIVSGDAEAVQWDTDLAGVFVVK